MAADNDFALDYLADCLYDAVLHQAGAVRPAQLLRSLPSDLRVGVGLIRKLLDEDERFVEVDGRYDIAGRDSLRHRPFGGLVEALLDAYGRPMSAGTLARALVRVRGGSPSGARKLLDEYAAGRENILVLDGRVLLSEWLLRVGGQTEEELLFYNGLSHDQELREMWQACARRNLRKRDPVATAAAILDFFRRPIGLLQLGFLAAVHHPQIFDPVQFIRDLMADRSLTFVHGPRVLNEWLFRAAQQHLKKLSEKAKGAEDVMPAAELVALLNAEPPDDAADFLSAEERDNILAVVSEARSPIGINELLADILEMRPNARKYRIAAHAVQALLDADRSLMRTSAGHYFASAAVPGWVSTVPDELIPDTFDPEQDVLLRVEGLHETLQQAVADPTWEDIRSGVPIRPDEQAISADRIEYPLMYHHYLAGTMFVRTIDRGLLGGEGSISVLTLRAPEGDVFSVWLNRELQLIFGLGAWYRDHVPPVGAIISLTPGEGPGEFLIENAGRMDQATALAPQRVAVLEERRERFATRPISVFDLLVDIIAEHRSGIRFDALWAEVNVVRRVTRLQIASALSWFRCFSFVGGKTQGWKFASDLINEGGREELAEFLVQRKEPPESGS